MNKPDCYKCIFRRDISGDTHSMCVHPETGLSDDNPASMMFAIMATKCVVPVEIGATPAKKLNVIGRDHGYAHGWFNWPLNFDPIWLLNCNGFKEVECQSKDALKPNMEP